MTLLNQEVTLNPLSPWGYERKLTALYGLHQYNEAIEALDKMLLRLKSSSDPQSCGTLLACLDSLLLMMSFAELRQQGVHPPQVATAISAIVTENVAHHLF